METEEAGCIHTEKGLSIDDHGWGKSTAFDKRRKKVQHTPKPLPIPSSFLLVLSIS
jgi:hypothetical protein